ncbi:hypothetical protein HPB47_017790 [Ixodes persulcatus]|uniref:Uncharacterized protein n=1 Tax=Ixodes persulcatus TaxID=34615 RepID=A0AC60QMD6_IXOPE|nr:hypothetical protein HPB47_017790 [Ixodes persulcatus]
MGPEIMIPDKRDGRGGEGQCSRRMPRALLRDLNAALSCVLCGGYLVNAATLVDCLHSCDLQGVHRALFGHQQAVPICDVPVHKSRPLSCLRVDKTLQDIVYKVVLGLYQREMKQRREFYDQHPDAASKVPCLEDRGVVEASGRLLFSPQHTVSVSLEYFTGIVDIVNHLERFQTPGLVRKAVVSIGRSPGPAETKRSGLQAAWYSEARLRARLWPTAVKAKKRTSRGAIGAGNLRV